MNEFPMRINKYLALQGLTTRRGADAAISAGKVFINGRRAVLGDKVEQSDAVELKGAKKDAARRVYFAYHKPRGLVTHSPTDGEEDIAMKASTAPELAGTFPIGRLDKDSSGLIILTNDGRITDRLLNPTRDHDKEYLVRTIRPLRKSFKDAVEKGVLIEGYETKPSSVRIHGEKTFSIVLTEGKKHQVRRMVVAMHNEVASLQRTRIMNITLGRLREGAYRPIEGKELEEFLKRLGLA